MSSLADNPLASNLTDILPGNNNIENQIYILGSHDHIFNTIVDMQLFVSYYDDNNSFKKQILHNIPFKIVIDKSKLNYQNVNLLYRL